MAASSSSRPVPKVLSEIYLAFIEEQEEEELITEESEEPTGEVKAEAEQAAAEGGDTADDAEWNSKIGGIPDWLAPLKEPPTCPGGCGTPMPLLVQIYAPMDEVSPDAYHRFLYIFACPNVPCHERASPYSCVRYQQSSEVAARPFIAKKTKQQQSLGFSLCAVCGHHAPNKCGKCRSVSYCTKAHQVSHWKAGHKLDCASGLPAAVGEEGCEAVDELLDGWDEFRLDTARELDILEEPELLASAKEDSAVLLKGTMEALRNLQKGVEVQDEDFQHNKDHVDSQTLKFQARVKPAGDQVLRYGQPVLWVHSNNQPRPDMIPACEACGAARQYEFQVLPQLLYYLHVDQKAAPLSPVSINFSTLAVYTCSNSCSTGYQKEFIWVQHE